MDKTRKAIPIVLSVIIVILAAVVVALLIFMKNQPVETRGIPPLIEIAEMEALKNPRRRIEYFAGRFAAKEACFKALGIGIFNTVLDQVEVLADETGRPYLRVSETVRSAYIGEYASCSVSISHDGSYAVAVVLLEK